MKIKTSVQGGRKVFNHNASRVKSTKGVKVKTKIQAGRVHGR